MLCGFEAGGRAYSYHSIAAAGARAARLPYTLKILLENVLRQRAEGNGRDGDVERLLSWPDCGADGEIRFRPARVMMDDTAGIPLVGNLAAMRDAAARLGCDPRRVAPALPVDFIVDHSVIADHTAASDAMTRNVALEFSRNAERYRFLRWGEHAFENLRVVPPGNGICHQINLEYLARVVCTRQDGARTLAFPDTMVGIDSHTPMVNGMGVVGWGVSGMEGLAAALGEPVALRIPPVVGCRLTGRLNPGVTATDLVLTLVETLRRHDVVGKFVEYCGPGVGVLTVPDRATVSNMTPEAGATMSLFPLDAETLAYLRVTGRDEAHIALVEAYAKAQGLWRDEASPHARYSEIIEFDLGRIEACVSGPSQPHHRVPLSKAPGAFMAANPARTSNAQKKSAVKDGDIVIAAITSCTNTSNPAGMLMAGLVARNAVARGLKVKPWVKTSLSPGSRVVADYLQKTGLQKNLDALGFNVAGYGCMTCVGFSGPLAAPVAADIEEYGIAAAAVLSGNRNYDGRIHAQVRASFLASPPLVVAYALAGSMLGDVTAVPLGTGAQGRDVYLRDLWPGEQEVRELIAGAVVPDLFTRSYAKLYEGSTQWRALDHQGGEQFAWDARSTVIRRPPVFDDIELQPPQPADITGARVLAVYGDLVTTEHVSPMGPIPGDSLAAEYLKSVGVAPRDFVSFAARRLNHDVMTRGTFASVHLRNEMTPGQPGGLTVYMPESTVMPIYAAAQRYARDHVPLIVIAGRGFGAGSSRDWSALGPRLLGVRAVIAESFERIYRGKLVAAGVLPLEFAPAQTRRTLRLDGSETLDFKGVRHLSEPGAAINCMATRADGTQVAFDLVARLDTRAEMEYFRHGGILQYLLRKISAKLP